MTLATGTVTRADVEHMSEMFPHLRYEITAQGALEATVTPAKNQHGKFALMLGAWLASEYGWDRVSAESGVSVSRSDPDPYRQPDVMLFSAPADPEERYNDPDNVTLAVEILSPSTGYIDWSKKAEEYAAVGIPNYWVVDPGLALITMFVLEPGRGTYRQAAECPIDKTLAESRPGTWLRQR